MPVITRPQLEKILIRRSRAKLAYGKLDVATQDGTNQDLADVIATAIRSLGLRVIDPTNPTDVDLAAVTDGQLPQLLDIGELASLELALGNRASPDQTADTNNEQYHGRLYAELEKTVARKAKECRAKYGHGDEAGPDGVAGRSPGAVGVLRLDISSDWEEC